jgi:hypothetical protein
MKMEEEVEKEKPYNKKHLEHFQKLTRTMWENLQI